MVINFIIISGLVLLDESSNYSWQQLLRIGYSSMLIVIGIYISTLKQSAIILMKEGNNEEVSSTVAEKDDLNNKLISKPVAD